MKIVTISREFGSGGRELGKRMADILGFDYYDSEIIYAVAQKSGFDAAYVEETLDNHGWQDIPITFSGTLGSMGYIQSNTVNLLLQQKKVIEEIAALGKDCVIVGRNADVILNDFKPLSIFVCADMQAKIQRCQNRAKDGETLTEKQLVKRIKHIDKMRAKTRSILAGQNWGSRENYHLTVNTTDWQIKELAEVTSKFADAYFNRTK